MGPLGRGQHQLCEEADSVSVSDCRHCKGLHQDLRIRSSGRQEFKWAMWQVGGRILVLDTKEEDTMRTFTTVMMMTTILSPWICLRRMARTRTRTRTIRGAKGADRGEALLKEGLQTRAVELRLVRSPFGE